MTKQKYTEEEKELIRAILKNDTDKIADMCEANPNLMTGLKDDVLFVAAQTKDIEENTIGTLAEFGANFLARLPATGGTCLHGAMSAHPGNTDSILRIYNSVLIEVQDLDQRTAAKKIAEFVNMTDFSGHTPIHYTANEKSSEARKLLIKNGGNINAQNMIGETVGHLVIQEIIKTGKENKRPEKQREQDCFIEVEELVKDGLDPAIKNKKGKTVLDFLSKEGKVKIKALHEKIIPDLSQLSMSDKINYQREMVNQRVAARS